MAIIRAMLEMIKPTLSCWITTIEQEIKDAIVKIIVRMFLGARVPKHDYQTLCR